MFDPTLAEPKQDLVLAKRLLTEAGYPNGGFSLTYVYFAPYEWQRINGEMLQAALSPMGVNVRIEGLPFTTISQRMTNPNTRPDIAAVGSTIPIPDPDILLYPILRSGSTYYANNGFKNEQLDKLLDDARSALDPKARAALYARIQRMVLDEAPIIPLTILNDIKLARADVRGYQFDAMNPAAVNLYDLYFAGE
jgi:peptide/nickel transport system substrate-binding protein